MSEKLGNLPDRAIGRGFRSGKLKIVEGCYRYREASLCAYSKARTISARVVLVSMMGCRVRVCRLAVGGMHVAAVRCVFEGVAVCEISNTKR